MLERFKESLFGRELEQKERVFRISLLLGFFVFLIAITEEMVINGFHWVLITYLFAAIIIGISIYVTFRYNRMDLAALLIGIYLVFVIFPSTFIQSGGMNGGASFWFVLGMGYVSLMFTGKRFYVMFICTVLMDVGVFILQYYHPEWIRPMRSETSVILDSAFSLIVVSVTIGILFKFQMRIFEKEREIIQRQAKEMEAISQSKDTFFANMSHEIRTPINTIIGLNEMILRQTEDTEIIENATDIQHASKMLLELVNDILDMSKIETGNMKIVMAPYDTRALFQGLLKIIKVNAKKKGLQLYVDIDEALPRVLYGDEKRIGQVLLNLLTNAVKYTQEGSITLSVRTEFTELENVRLYIDVTDTGIGIKKEDIGDLFQSFKRVDLNSTHKIEGTGLGLSITRQLVEMMGGEIMVDSIYTKGSTFTVILVQKIVDRSPIENVELLVRSGATEHHHYKQLFEAPEARILVVDDNDMNLNVVKKLLEATKLKIDFAKSGEECLRQAEKHYYHIILLDYMMPGLSGPETMRLLRKQEGGLCHDSVVIALTANTLPGGEAAYQSMGFDAFLEKPVTGEIMEEKLLEYLPDELVEFRLHSENDSDSVQLVSKKKKRKICITTECLCDIPEYLREQYDIRLMYLYIKTPDGRYRDSMEIDSTNLSRQMTNEIEIMADSATVEEYESFFAEVLTEAEEIIHIAVGDQLGVSYKNAQRAAQSFGHVHVLNSGQVSCGQGLLVLNAGLLAAEGVSLREIYTRVSKVKNKVNTGFLMAAPGLLTKRGYVTGWLGKLCTRFSVNPIMTIRKGKLRFSSLCAGRRNTRLTKFVSRRLRMRWRIDRRCVYVTYVGLSGKQLESVLAEIRKRVAFEEIVVQSASVSCSCTGGFGTVGISYFTK